MPMTDAIDIDLAGPLEFFVEGHPATQGSKVAFKHAISGKVCVKDSNKRLAEWRATVALAARLAMRGRAMFEGAVSVNYVFYLPRPKKDFTRSGALREGAPRWPLQKMDWEKMARAVGDAMTGWVYADDGQICYGVCSKHYADGTPPGVRITVNALG